MKLQFQILTLLFFSYVSSLLPQFNLDDSSVNDRVFLGYCDQPSLQTFFDTPCNFNGSTSVYLSGDCLDATWYEPLVIDMNTYDEDVKVLTVYGKSAADEEKLRVFMNFSANGALLVVNLRPESLFRLTEFEFKSTSVFSSQNCYGLSLVGVGHVRIDNNIFSLEHVMYQGIIEGLVEGVFDNNEIVMPWLQSHNPIAFDVRWTMDPEGNSVNGDYSWSQPLDLGSLGQLYFESNLFRGSDGHDVDKWRSLRLYAGARVVFRNNILENSTTFVVQGTCTEDFRGGFSYEIYDNEFRLYNESYTELDLNSAITLRAGTGVIANNRFVTDVVGEHVGIIPIVTLIHLRTFHPACRSPVWKYCTGYNPIDQGNITVKETATQMGGDSYDVFDLSKSWQTDEYAYYMMSDGSDSVYVQSNTDNMLMHDVSDDHLMFLNESSVDILVVYPCLDQVGFSMLEEREPINRTDLKVQTQDSIPLYLYGNTLNGVIIEEDDYFDESLYVIPPNIVIGRDVIVNQPLGTYTPAIFPHPFTLVDECGNCDFASCDQFSGNCSVCQDGWWGDSCHFSCSEHCSACDQRDGECSSCEDTFWGESCMNLCNSTCASCSKDDGDCNGDCVEFYQGSDCDSCVDYHYGNDCVSFCEAANYHTDCQSCLNYHHGSDCSSTCEASNYNTDCSSCLDYHHGSDCSSTCEAANYNTDCTTCLDYHHGSDCSSTCEASRYTADCQSCLDTSLLTSNDCIAVSENDNDDDDDSTSDDNNNDDDDDSSGSQVIEGPLLYAILGLVGFGVVFAIIIASIVVAGCTIFYLVKKRKEGDGEEKNVRLELEETDF